MDILQTLRSLAVVLRDRKGVTALEYGIIAGILGLVLSTIFTTFGSKLSTLFSWIGGSI
jgi:pilus assembly protein Flp/PilA